MQQTSESDWGADSLVYAKQGSRGDSAARNSLRGGTGCRRLWSQFYHLLAVSLHFSEPQFSRLHSGRGSPTGFIKAFVNYKAIFNLCVFLLELLRLASEGVLGARRTWREALCEAPEEYHDNTSGSLTSNILTLWKAKVSEFTPYLGPSILVWLLAN